MGDPIQGGIVQPDFQPPDIERHPLYINPNHVDRAPTQYKSLPYEAVERLYGTDDRAQAFDKQHGAGSWMGLQRQAGEHVTAWDRLQETLRKVKPAVGEGLAAAAGPTKSLFDNIFTGMMLSSRALYSAGATLNDPELKRPDQMNLTIPGEGRAPLSGIPMVKPSWSNIDDIFKKHWDSDDAKEFRFRNSTPGNFIGRTLLTANEFARDLTDNVNINPFNVTQKALHGIIVPNEHLSGDPQRPWTEHDDAAKKEVQRIMHFDRPLAERWQAIFNSKHIDNQMETWGPWMVDLPANIAMLPRDPLFMAMGSGVAALRLREMRKFLTSAPKTMEEFTQFLRHGLYGGGLSAETARGLHDLVYPVVGGTWGKAPSEAGLQNAARLLVMTDLSPIPSWANNAFVKKFRGIRHQVDSGMMDVLTDYELERHLGNTEAKAIYDASPTLKRLVAEFSPREKMQFALAISQPDRLKTYSQHVVAGKAPMVTPQVFDAVEEFDRAAKQVFGNRQVYWGSVSGEMMREARINHRFAFLQSSIVNSNLKLITLDWGNISLDDLAVAVVNKSGQVNRWLAPKQLTALYADRKIDMKKVVVISKAHMAEIPLSPKDKLATIADLAAAPAEREVYTKRLRIDDVEAFDPNTKLADERNRTFLLPKEDKVDMFGYAQKLFQKLKTDPTTVDTELTRVIKSVIEQSRIEKRAAANISLKRDLSAMISDLNSIAGLPAKRKTEVRVAISEFADFLSEKVKTQEGIDWFISGIDSLNKDFKRWVLFNPLAYPRYFLSNISENYMKNFMWLDWDDLFKKHNPFDLNGKPFDAVRRSIPRENVKLVGAYGDPIKSGFYDAKADWAPAFLGKYSDLIDQLNEVAEGTRNILFSHSYYKRAQELSEAHGVMSRAAIHKRAWEYANKTVQDVQFFHESLPVGISWMERFFPFLGTYMLPTLRFNLKMLAQRPGRSRLIGMMADQMNRDGELTQDGKVRLRIGENGKEVLFNPGFAIPLMRFSQDAQREPGVSDSEYDKTERALGLLNALSFGFTQMSRIDPRNVQRTLPAMPKLVIDGTDWAFERATNVVPGYESERKLKTFSKDIARILSPVDIFYRMVNGESMEDIIDKHLSNRQSRLSTMLKRMTEFEWRAAAIGGEEISREEAEKRAKSNLAWQAIFNIIPGSSKIISSPAMRELLEYRDLYKTMPDFESRRAMKDNFHPEIPVMPDGSRVGDYIVPSEFYVPPNHPEAEYLTDFKELMDSGDRTGAINRFRAGNRMQKFMAFRLFGQKLKEMLTPDDLESMFMTEDQERGLYEP